MSWIDVANKLDNSIFRQALTDAVTDMCFYEGDEATDEMEQYINLVKDGKNTVDLDQAIMDRLVPYMENSILIYGKYLAEGEIKSGGGQFVTGASSMKAKQASGVASAEVSGLHPTYKKTITEGTDMNPVGLKADTGLVKTGDGPHNNIELNDTGNISPIAFKGEGDYEFALTNGIEAAKAKSQPLDGNTDLGKVTHAGIVYNKGMFEEMIKTRSMSGSGNDKYYPTVVKDAETPSS